MHRIALVSLALLALLLVAACSNDGARDADATPDDVQTSPPVETDDTTDSTDLDGAGEPAPIIAAGVFSLAAADSFESEGFHQVIELDTVVAGGLHGAGRGQPRPGPARRLASGPDVRPTAPALRLRHRRLVGLRRSSGRAAGWRVRQPHRDPPPFGRTHPLSQRGWRPGRRARLLLAHLTAHSGRRGRPTLGRGAERGTAGPNRDHDAAGDDEVRRPSRRDRVGALGRVAPTPGRPGPRRGWPTSPTPRSDAAPSTARPACRPAAWPAEAQFRHPTARGIVRPNPATERAAALRPARRVPRGGLGGPCRSDPAWAKSSAGHGSNSPRASQSGTTPAQTSSA